MGEKRPVLFNFVYNCLCVQESTDNLVFHYLVNLWLGLMFYPMNFMCDDVTDKVHWVKHQVKLNYKLIR